MVRACLRERSCKMPRKKAAVRKPRTREEQYERRRAMAAEVKAGATAEEVAEKYGVTAATVRIACNQFKVPLQPTGARGRPAGSGRSYHFEIVAALLAGRSMPDIAEEFGITRQAVHEIKQRAEAAGVFAGVKQANKAEVEALREKERLERRIDQVKAEREARQREAEKRYQKIIDMVQSGKTVEEVAEAVGFNTLTVYRIMRRFGVELYAPHLVDDETRFKILRDVMRATAKGELNATEIGKRYGVGPHTVLRIRDTAEKAGLFKEAKKFEG